MREGHMVEPGQKRASFLNIRLTGQELTQLRDIAGKFGVGPSTYARHVLKTRINQEQVKLENAERYAPSLNNAGCARDSTGNSVNISNQSGIYVFDTGSSKVNPDILQSLLDILNKICACKLLTPGDLAYTEAEKLLNYDATLQNVNYKE
jgi:hypothetical protein